MRVTVQSPGAGPLRVHSQWEKLGSSVLPLKSKGFLDPGSSRDRPLGTPENVWTPHPHPPILEGGAFEFPVESREAVCLESCLTKFLYEMIQFVKGQNFLTSFFRIKVLQSLGICFLNHGYIPSDQGVRLFQVFCLPIAKHSRASHLVRSTLIHGRRKDRR